MQKTSFNCFSSQCRIESIEEIDGEKKNRYGPAKRIVKIDSLIPLKHKKGKLAGTEKSNSFIAKGICNICNKAVAKTTGALPKVEENLEEIKENSSEEKVEEKIEEVKENPTLLNYLLNIIVLEDHENIQ